MVRGAWGGRGNWADQSHQLRARAVENHRECASRGTTVTLLGDEALLNQHMDMESESVRKSWEARS